MCVVREGDYLLLKLTQAQAAGRVESRVSDLIMQQVVCVCVCVCESARVRACVRVCV